MSRDHPALWWPTRERDVRRFVASCHVCAQTKSSNTPPAGLLRPLPIPSRPWSHIALDFVTGLPLSAGNTVILTVVDRFSKAAHFIPLPRLPSARETAQVMVDHVFKIHGLPSDIVSDREPQFTSQFWREFCRQIGASPSLSSGFHPQTNGQAERTNQILGRMLRSLTSRTPRRGPTNCPGPSMPIILCPRPPLGYPRSSVVWVTNPHYLHPKSPRPLFPPWRHLFRDVDVPGRG